MTSETRRYLTGFLALVALTATAVAAAVEVADVSSRSVVVLGIAVVEAVVGLTLFMRIKAEPWMIYGALLLTAVCLGAALALPVWSEQDHIMGTHHRVWDAGVAAPGSPPPAGTPVEDGR